MAIKALILATGIVAILAIAISPYMSTVFADPAPKEDPSCSDPKFADRDSCPGASEDASGGDRDDECTARNRGQSSDDCNDAIVNPPN